ncbi:hypothetical protein HQQ85_15950 [Herbiconiux sp. VKM Ac-2851]|nr:hypothetical protein [Herbiconiux sp. VKM Ac-2851]
MTAPTQAVRLQTYGRDLSRCVSCGRRDGLEFQHRRRTGMGGSKLPVQIADGLASCLTCNPAYEHALQTRALFSGWKVRSWVKQPELVPVFYVPEMSWWRLTTTGDRYELSAAEVPAFMHEVYGEQWLQWADELNEEVAA